MSYQVGVESASARRFAAVRARCIASEVPRAFKGPLDKVWAFLKQHSELRPDHNLFLYHHPAKRGDPMEVDFGVEVDRAFDSDGEVECRETPVSKVAVVVHRGPYSGMRAAHEALHAWCAANGHAIGSSSWEIYGDWDSDESKLETTIFYAIL
jgi:effector-binding domain-containing protein